MTKEQVASLWKASVLLEAVEHAFDDEERQVYVKGAQDFVQHALSLETR